MAERATGEGLYRGGAVSWLVYGGVHLLAVYKAHFGEPPDERYAAIDQSLRDYSMPLGPFHPTAWGNVQILNESYSILLLSVGALNLVVARSLASTGRLRAGAIVNAILAGALLAVCLAHQFPPPALFALVTACFFVVCAIRAGRAWQPADQART